MKIAYADPPYPGCAHLYPEKTEVDHKALISELGEFDGWALSTNENALQELLSYSPRGVRVLAWCKNNAPPFFDHPYRAWEPVICKPARTEHPPVRIRSYFVSAAPTGIAFDKSPLTGSKSAEFCEWIIRCLGAKPEDELTDLFPGTGVMARVWSSWASRPELWGEAPAQPRREVRERLQRETHPDLFGEWAA